MTPDESDDVIANLPRSRPARRSPRRDAAQAKAATAQAKADGAGPKKAAAVGSAKPATAARKKPAARAGAGAGARKAGARKPAKPVASRKPAAKPPIPAAGYAVPGDDSSSSGNDVLTEALRAAGQLAQAGVSTLRGLIGRG